LSIDDWKIWAFVAIHSTACLLVRRRAARHFKPGVSAATRLGIGWGMLRRASYTEKGQSARSWLVILYVGALPLVMLIKFLLSPRGR
jgi:hypothetical protein